MNSVQLLLRSRLLSWLLFASWQVTALSQAVATPSEGQHQLWQIGQVDNNIAEFALAPTNYTHFLEWFGSPDRAYYIGLSAPQTDWPYILPGIVDRWAGSSVNIPRHLWDQMNTLPIGFV